MNHAKVSVIILNWNGLEDTVECLESLKNITYHNYEVVLVDNGSEGNDVRILREKFGNYVHIIEKDKNYGFAEGCNIGMRYALSNLNPDYILLLNNDTVVDPDFLTELVKVAESDPLTGIVGPKICFYYEPNRIQAAGGRINWWTGQISLIGGTRIDMGQFDESREVDWVIGCALLIKQRTIEKIGLLYAGYFAYVEETDWCARAGKAGFEVVYAPGARVWHKRRLAAARIDEIRLYYRTRNLFLFMKRNSSRLQLICFFVQFFLRNVPLTMAFLLFRQREPKLLPTFYKGTCDGIRLMLKRYGSGG